MKDETIILIGAGAALLLYSTYTNWKNTIPERGDTNIINSKFSSGAKIIQYGNTAYKFKPDDWQKLNFAQRFLYGLGISPNLLFK
jgi:hypothetical protein